MKKCWITVVSLLPALLLAEDYVGADKVMERLAAREAVKVTEEEQVNPGQALRRQMQELKAATGLSADEKAARWMTLLDAYLSLSPAALRSDSFGERLELTELLAVLPPAEAWGGIARQLGQRTSSQPLQDSILRLLGVVLTGDVAAWEGELARLNQSLEQEKSEPHWKQSYKRQIRELTSVLRRLRGDSAAVVADFEQVLEEMDNEVGRGIWMRVPDLLRLGGREKAEPLLVRALKLRSDYFSVDGATTKSLAADLALREIDHLQQPFWQLVHRPEDVALYEALKRKFPDSSSHDRLNASKLYWVALIHQGRIDEAVRHVEQELLVHQDLLLQLSLRELEERGGQEDAAAVHAFLRQWLGQRPEWPLWEVYISLAARESASGEALALMKEVLARPELEARVRQEVSNRLHLALLAAGEREEGVKLLRELVREGPVEEGKSTEAMERLRKAGVKATREMTNLVTGMQGMQESQRMNQYFDACVRLTELGRLLNEAEWVEEGIAAALATLQNLGVVGGSNARVGLVSKVARLLEKQGRGIQAEALLISELERMIGPDTKSQGMGAFTSAGELLKELVAVYDAAGRHADVLQLLERSPHWGVVDLEEIGEVNGTSVMPMAARALQRVGRKDEARRILRRVLFSNPGMDEIYQLLLEVEDEGGMLALLAEVERLDRFEERPLIWKAQLHLSAGRLEEAEATIRAAIAIDPSDGEQGKGDRMRAYAVLAEVLERRGDAATAAVMRGAVSAVRKSEEADDWWKAGLLTEAVRRYEAALLDFADAYCIQSRLALRYVELGDFAKAEQHYLRAFELMPDSFGRVESHCFGCEGAFRGERAQNAADKVFSALAAKPDAKAQVHYLLGYLRKSQGKPEEAVAAYRLAVQQDPDYLNAWSKLLELAVEVDMPAAENERAALEVLRLDPLGRRGMIGIKYVCNLSLLWTRILEAEKQLPVAETGPLWELTASKARLDQPGEPATRMRHRIRRSLQDELWRLWISHPALQQIAVLIDSLRYR